MVHRQNMHDISNASRARGRLLEARCKTYGRLDSVKSYSALNLTLEENGKPLEEFKQKRKLV